MGSKPQWIVTASLLLLGAGCTSQPIPEVQSFDDLVREETAEINFPMEGYVDHRTDRAFGEMIHDGRFNGFHVADDVEVDDLNREYPVVAIADGEVTFAGFINGYGGMVRVAHTIGGEPISAIYGHVDTEHSTIAVGDQVEKGQFLGNLGDHETHETDGGRKHLHFGLYEGRASRLAGYEATERAMAGWLNPHDVFEQFGPRPTSPKRLYPHTNDVEETSFAGLSFVVPENMEVEYVHEIDAINVYSLSGDGAARDRSQLFIRFFDAEDFLTLPTVTIHETEDLTVGRGNYTARRYDIEKKTGVANFVNQPDWRNERHVVTDFRAADGFTRYFVVAANPDLDPGIYEDVLKSMSVK